MITFQEIKLAEANAIDAFLFEKARIRDRLISIFDSLIKKGETTLDGLLARLSSDEQYVVRCYMPNFVAQLSTQMEVYSKTGEVPDIEAIERASIAADDTEYNFLSKPFFDDIDAELVFDLARSGSLMSDKAREILALDEARKKGLFPLLIHYLKIARQKK